MRTFAAVSSNGIAYYTLQPSDANTQMEGVMTGPYTLREFPNNIAAENLLSNYFWKENSWSLLPVKMSDYFTWDLEIESWVDERAISDVKAKHNTYINNCRASANQTSFTFSGKQIAVDALSRGDIDAVVGTVALTNEMPAGWAGGWKTLDNTYASIPDVASWKEFYAAMVAQGTFNFKKSQELKEQLDLATTIEEVEAIVW